MHRTEDSTDIPGPEPASESVRSRGDRVAKLLLWGTTALLGAAFLRTVQLQVWPDETVLSLMGRRHATVAEIRPRGDIYDRKGRLIATTVLGHDLGVDPKFLMDVADKVTTDDGEPIANPLAWLADTVSMHTGIDREVLEDRLGPELVVDVAALMRTAYLLHHLQGRLQVAFATKSRVMQSLARITGGSSWSRSSRCYRSRWAED